MIKYFYYEEHLVDEKVVIINEKILNEDPQTDRYGYIGKYDKYGKFNKFYVDVEKIIEYFGELDDKSQIIYDKLLIQERNLKLETL